MKILTGLMILATILVYSVIMGIFYHGLWQHINQQILSIF